MSQSSKYVANYLISVPNYLIQRLKKINEKFHTIKPIGHITHIFVDQSVYGNKTYIFIDPLALGG